MQLEIVKKIDFKKFFLSSLLPTALTFFFARSVQEFIALFLMYIATVLYVLMFSEMVFLMARGSLENDFKVDKRYLAFLFIAKLVILISAIIYAVDLLKVRTIIPLGNYVIHIFILASSIKKNPSH